MKTLYVDTPYAPFKEGTLDALLNKEGYLVAFDTLPDTVKLATSADEAIGVLFAKRSGDPHVNVRLLGKGGTVRVVAGGVIAKGGRATWGAGGKVVALPTATGTYRSLGFKCTQGNSANNDVVELLDVVETRIVP